MSYRIDLTPTASYTETVSVSQDDVGREIVVDLYKDGTAYTPTTGTTITMQGTKPSGLGYTITGTASGSTITFLTTEEMTQEAGRFASEIVLTNGDTVIGTANFALYVEKNPHPSNTIDGTGKTMRTLTARMDALEDDVAALESATDVPAGYVPTADGQDGWQWEDTGIGALTDLTTEAKTSVVAAVNEVDAAVDENTANLKTLDAANDGVVTPRFFADDLTGMLGRSLPATYVDDHYITHNSTENAFAGVSIQTSSIVGGNKYRFTTWTAMAGNTGSFGNYYDANGNLAGRVVTGAVLVDGTERTYEATAPDSAVLVRINVKKTEKYPIREVYVSNHNINLPEWMTQPQRKESIKKPITYSGVTGEYFGDSIAYGAASPNLATTTSYIKLFGDAAGAILLRAAISGTRFTDAQNANSILNKCLAAHNYNLFIVAGGINDFILNSPLGEYGDTTADTFYGAVDMVCKNFSENHSSADVIFITPLPMTKAYTDLHPAFRYGNSNGNTIDDFRKAIYEVATTYDYSVVDGSSLGFPTGTESGGWANVMCDDSDGLHPTVKGHQMLARSLAGKLL